MLWHGKNFRGIINKAKQMIFDNTGTDLISTNAEDAIKEVNSNLSANTKGTVTDLKPYTGPPLFTCPSDGYIYCVTTNGVLNDVVNVTVCDPNNQVLCSVKSITMVSGQEGNQGQLFVRKGMRLYCSFGGSGSNNSVATFTELS